MVGRKTGLGRMYEHMFDCHIRVKRQDWEEHMSKLLIATYRYKDRTGKNI
jgi:hypothetical protein